ncbi:MAG: leucine-rich repeat protein, partial [Bacteroidales bacterium]|nr:leucine-rich repeat protein [Bacteroidales bacterium]
RSIWGRIADADVTAEQTVTASKYLTFTSTGSTTVSLTNEGENAPVLYCSTDAQTWTLWDYSELTFTSDAPLYLCGDNPNGFSKNSGKYSMFVSSGDLFSISGDVMSLLNRADDLQAIPCSSCFRNLFKGCTNLAEAPSLPADSLMSECYLRMFMDCSALVVAPSLPATSLTWGCYNGMFKGCSSLTATPALPASELAEYCYHEMFSGCSALTSTSTLPATVMKEGSYYMMFYGCENLLSAPELPATTLASSCYIGMFQNCTMLTSVPETLPATTLELHCYHSMFRDCHSLTKAPLLPAENLVESCYETMFYSCYSLIYVKCLATGLSGENCLKEWMTDVSSQGTFVKAANAQWPTGTSGIPEGWTVENASSASQYLTFSSRGTTTVSLTNVGNNAPVLYYSTDAQTWTQWDYSGLTFTADAPLYICGDNPQGFGTGNSSFRMSGDNVAVSGDIMSLINKDQAVTVIPSASCFYGLFYQCSALVSAPELPATTLTEYCYYNMFYGCSNLIEAPELPATTLAPWCYGQMFAACTSLVTAPNLPAETLVNACYYHMFQNSTSLEYVTCMATDISADEATTTWLEDVAATGTFVKAPNSQWPIGSSGIPQGWTVENAL